MKAFHRKSALGRLAIEFGTFAEWDFDFVTRRGTLSADPQSPIGAWHESGAWTIESLLQNVYEGDREQIARLFNSSYMDDSKLLAEFRVVQSRQPAMWLRLSGIVEHELGVPLRAHGIAGEIPPRTHSVGNSPIQSPPSSSRLIASMSHELRTPLSAIIGFTDLLIAGTVSAQSPKHGQFLGHIRTAGRQLLQLVNDILDLSKIEAGVLELFPERIRLAEFLADVLNSLPTKLVNSADIQYKLDTALPSVWADPIRLKQVLLYYLAAGRSVVTPNGTVTIRVTVNSGSGLRLEIVPTLAPTSVRRLESVETEPIAEHPKLDILTRELCRRLIEAQGGLVQVKESPEETWSVEILLDGKEPLLPEAEDSSRVSIAPMPRLLAIQDDRRDPHVLSRGLVEAGFDVDTVVSGEQAMEQAAQRMYDAIALDLLIHGQSGLSVLQAIRADGPNSQSPVVSVSIAPDNGDVASFAVTDILAKPIRTAEVAQAMQRLQLSLNRTARVLVIDDDTMAIDLMRATLGAYHIECMGLCDGRRAIEEIELHRPDALILDMMMPEFDGFAVLDSLHRSVAARDIPVFIWTNMTLTRNEYMSLKHSATAILSKGGGTIEALRDDLRKRRHG